jgi:hypothetical protein
MRAESEQASADKQRPAAIVTRNAIGILAAKGLKALTVSRTVRV